MDPTATELQAMAQPQGQGATPLGEAIRWVGLTAPAVEALRGSLGQFTLARQIVFMPDAAWEQGLNDAQVAAHDADPERSLSALEIGQAGSLRRVARLLCGIPPSGMPPIGGGPALQPNPPLPGGPPPATPVGTRKVKVASVVDQADDAEVIAMDVTLVRRLQAEYTAANDGIPPDSDEENDSAQLVALKSKLDADVVPYADFAVYRPFGHRLASAKKFQAHIWKPTESTFVIKELPGPPDFREWLRCWKLYTCGLRTLKAVSQQRMAKYRDKIAELDAKYSNLSGGGGWWLIAMADIRMRSERMERLRQRLEKEDTERRTAGLASNFDQAKPWDSVFLAASVDAEFWDTEVREKAVLYATHIRTRPELEDDGHHVATSPGAAATPQSKKRKPDSPAKPWGQGTTAKAKRRAVARQGGGDSTGGNGRGRGPKGRGKGTSGARDAQVCWSWQQKDGCAVECPNGRKHVCSGCGGAHRQAECTTHPKGKGKGS